MSVSVLAGARLLASADATEPVWALSTTAGAGAPVGADELSLRRVRFAEPADRDLYFSAAEPLPSDLVLTRSVGAGELLARSAVAPSADVAVRHVPLEVPPPLVPPAVASGSVVDVYLADRGARGGGRTGLAPALSRVTVVAAPVSADTFAVSGLRQVVVAVPVDDVEGFQALLAAAEDPVLTLVHDPGAGG